MPLTISRLRIELVGPARALGDGQVLALRGRLRLRLDDVDRRHRADLDARLVVADELLGELDRAARDFDRLHGEDIIPVGVPDVRHRVDDRRLQLNFRDVLVQLGDDELLPRVVDPEVAQQRLRVQSPTSWR